jgi:hypothetical protein
VSTNLALLEQLGDLMRTILTSTGGLESSKQQQLATGVSNMVKLIGDHGAAVGDVMTDMKLVPQTMAPAAQSTQETRHQEVGVRV